MQRMNTQVSVSDNEERQSVGEAGVRAPTVNKGYQLRRQPAHKKWSMASSLTPHCKKDWLFYQ